MEESVLLERMVLSDFEPDYTLYFKITLEESFQRLERRQGKKDRLDKETQQFKQRVFDGYEERYQDNLHRMHQINAMQSMEDVKSEVEAWVRNVFIPNNPITGETNGQHSQSITGSEKVDPLSTQ